MKIKRLLSIYILTSLLFFAIDLTWLGFLAKDFYSSKMGDLLRKTTNWNAAIIFYLIYIGGILYFAIVPTLQNKTSFKSALNGAILGFLCYSTFELTAFALIRDWPFDIVIPDILWGTILTCTVSLGVHFISRKLFFSHDSM